MAWNAANFLIAEGDVAAALPEFAVILRTDRALVPRALAICWRTIGALDPILNILPPDPAVYFELIKLLDSEDQPDAAWRVWKRLVELRLPIHHRDALFFLDHLLQMNELDRAEQVQKEIAFLSPSYEMYNPKNNLVVNGSFELEILNGGLDWRSETQKFGTSIALDTSEFVDGSRSLVVTFTGRSPDAGIYQLVRVKPDTEYTVSAWVKSAELETANGPRLTVIAPDSTVYARSEETMGTTSWRKIAASFKTGPTVRLVSLRFAREPGDTLVSGRLWIDNVRMTESNEGPAAE